MPEEHRPFRASYIVSGVAADRIFASLLEVQRFPEWDVDLSNASLSGRFCLRACFVNHRTTPEDVRTVVDAIEELNDLEGSALAPGQVLALP